jgi:hypothetical protein
MTLKTPNITSIAPARRVNHGVGLQTIGSEVCITWFQESGETARWQAASEAEIIQNGQRVQTFDPHVEENGKASE